MCVCVCVFFFCSALRCNYFHCLARKWITVSTQERRTTAFSWKVHTKQLSTSFSLSTSQVSPQKKNRYYSSEVGKPLSFLEQKLIINLMAKTSQILVRNGLENFPKYISQFSSHQLCRCLSIKYCFWKKLGQPFINV